MNLKKRLEKLESRIAEGREVFLWCNIRQTADEVIDAAKATGRLLSADKPIVIGWKE